MAHDIRSPLSVLSMVVAQEAGVNIERAKLLTAVLQRLNSIANGFLDFNKQMGRSAVVEILEAPSATAPETCLQTCSLADINSSLAGIVSEIRARCPSSVRITFEGPRDIPLVGVRCDKLELGRIFSNCMNNSVEALREDPKFVNVTLNCDGGEVLIEIRDSGCGIPEDKLNDLGMRVVPSEKPDGNGWAIFHAKSKLASWGGDLVLSSPQMRGTTVSIRLPALTLNS